MSGFLLKPTYAAHHEGVYRNAPTPPPLPDANCFKPKPLNLPRRTPSPSPASSPSSSLRNPQGTENLMAELNKKLKSRGEVDSGYNSPSSRSPSPTVSTNDKGIELKRIEAQIRSVQRKMRELEKELKKLESQRQQLLS